MKVFMCSLCNVETLLKAEIIFVNPVLKGCRYLTNILSLCVCPHYWTIYTHTVLSVHEYTPFEK